MSYPVTRNFSAPAEVVYGIATDLDRWARWLPAGVSVAGTGPDALRVVWPGGAEAVQWLLAPEDLAATARLAGGVPWSGTLQVDDTPAGGSTAQLRIDGDDGRLRSSAERALAYLDHEVADSLSAG
jgi:hypothetical protein